MAAIPASSFPSVFLMLGKTASLLGDHIASSIEDHLFAPVSAQMVYYCMTPQAEAVREALHSQSVYVCDDQVSATDVIQAAINEFNQRSQALTMAHANMGIIRVFFILKACDMTVTRLCEIQSQIEAYLTSCGRSMRSVLCLIADASPMQANAQEKFITDGHSGTVYPGLHAFEKIMLVTPHNLDGYSNAGVQLQMNDVIPLGLLMCDTMSDCIFTASHNKLNGSSADISRLHSHIAATSMDKWFARSNLSQSELWLMLSSPLLPFVTNGGNPLLSSASYSAAALANASLSVDKALHESASAWVPSLSDVMLTAPLKEKDADMAAVIMAFEDMNGAVFSSQEDWGNQWLQQILSSLPEQTHLDVLADALESETSDSIRSQLYTAWKNAREGLPRPDQTRQYLYQAMTTALSGMPGKKLLQSHMEYNLLALKACLSPYQELCRRRIISKRLDFILHHLCDISKEARRLVSIRKTALSRHMISEEQFTELSRLCSAFAENVAKSYDQLDIPNMMDYDLYQPYLYRPNDRGEYAWEPLYRLFRSRINPDRLFTPALVQNKSSQQLREVLEGLRTSSLLLPPPLPAQTVNTAAFYLSNNVLARLLPEKIDGSMMYTIPGDQVEYVCLQGLCSSADSLLDFNLFKSNGLSADFAPILKHAQSSESGAANSASSARVNPWEIRLKDQFLSWRHAPEDSPFTIRFNNRIVRQNYSCGEYVSNGMGMPLQDMWNSVPAGMFTVTITCAGQHEQWRVMGRDNRLEAALDVQRRPQVRTAGVAPDGSQYDIRVCCASASSQHASMTPPVYLSRDVGAGCVFRYEVSMLSDGLCVSPLFIDADNEPPLFIECN